MTQPTKPQIPNMRLLATTIRKTVNDTMIGAVGDWTEGQKDDFVVKIENQAFPDFREIFYPESGTNLSPRYLRRKRKAGVDLRTMVATGNYKDSIRVWRKLGKGRRGATWRVGFHPKKLARDFKNQQLDILLSQVAMIQEFGSVKNSLPARKHWRPHLAQMHKNALTARPRMRLMVVKNLRKALRGQAKVA
jgi:hypothetical protein